MACNLLNRFVGASDFVERLGAIAVHLYPALVAPADLITGMARLFQP
jgi:hypothetical protein